MSYPAIEAKGVRFSYGKNEILHGVDFAAQKGQLVAVLGPNGAGKSTLFRCLLGLYHSYQGSITIEGREVKNMQPRRSRPRWPISRRPIPLPSTILCWRWY